MCADSSPKQAYSLTPPAASTNTSPGCASRSAKILTVRSTLPHVSAGPHARIPGASGRTPWWRTPCLLSASETFATGSRARRATTSADGRSNSRTTSPPNAGGESTVTVIVSSFELHQRLPPRKRSFRHPRFGCTPCLADTDSRRPLLSNPDIIAFSGMAKKRKYELKNRAEQLAQTRLRITEATVELHRTLGPAATQISEIARRAGVQRLTVYNHFPDEASLFAACSAHWRALHPTPDPAEWAEIDDPRNPQRTALS